MRGRRRPKVTWLPGFGQVLGLGEAEKQFAGIDSFGEVTWDENYNGYLAVHALTVDQPNGEDPAEQASLADAIGSEWFLRRIVGKLFVSAQRPSSEDPWFDGVMVTAGFFVARSDYANVNFPIGATEALTTSQGLGPVWASYSPADARAIREPWIWRRKWILDASGNNGFTSNWFYGSVLDGPHIDAKTKRRISNDDRLYFAIAASAWPFDTPAAESSEEADFPSIRYHLDYRIVGSLRKARNRGVF